jgi:hypothetical protein
LCLLFSPVAQALHRQPKRRRKKLHDSSGVGSVGITARGPLDKYRFNMFMRDLLGEKARDIFRSKGVLCIKGQEATKFVFQGVHETICFGPAAAGWQPGEEPINQVVFIGRDLDRKVRGRRQGLLAAWGRPLSPWVASYAPVLSAGSFVGPSPHVRVPFAAALDVPPLSSPPPPVQALVEGFRSCVWVGLPEGWSEHTDPRTKQPYFVNSATGQKQWDRPQIACALVQSSEASHRQPTVLQPRRASDAADAIVAAQA